MAKSPEVFGPGMRLGCQLTCQKVASGQEIVIFSAKNVAQVIQSILFRVYDVRERAIMTSNWKTMLITMAWDGKGPQVRQIPLAGLFTNGFDYLREVRSLNAGVKMKTCQSKGHRVSEMKERDWLAYLFYDMPFWKSAKITIKRMAGLTHGIICTKITTKPLDNKQYNPRMTGYFSAQLHQQDFGITQENDVIVEIEETNAPTVSGTGHSNNQLAMFLDQSEMILTGPLGRTV